MNNTITYLICGLMLTACSGRIVETPTMVNRANLIVPSITPVEQFGFEWLVITKSNIDQIIKEHDNANDQLVIFGLTPQGYQNLSLDIAELRRYIQQQNAIIAAYKLYYNVEAVASQTIPIVEEPKKPFWKVW